jgi:hypothetical protein
MSVSYEESGPDLSAAVDEMIGDCTGVARDYAELRYGEDVLEQNNEEIEEIISNYANPFTDVLTRQDFFEKVKPEIDELLSQ